MADFSINIHKVINLEGGYQDDPNDSVNICNGVNAGTKYGVSAQAYQAYFGQCPSPDTMQNLTTDVAAQIGKGNYWDKLNLDNITNQSVADMMFDYVWGSGQGEIHDVKKVANQVASQTLISENNNILTDDEADIINNLDQESYFNALKAYRIQFFNNLATENPSRYGKYLQGWLNRMNAYTYTGNVKKK